MSFPGFDSPAYGTIGGALPWGVGGNPIGALNSDNPIPGLAAAYDRNYNNALAMNQSNYNNILAGYGSLLGSQQRAQAGISAGYGSLSDRTMGLLSDQGNSQAQAINDQYAAALGKQSQSLINRGLGNTTIQSSVARGNLLDKAKALNDNSERVSNLKAQYLSNIGLQGLGAQREFYQANTGLGNRQLDFMNSVNAKYPDAGMYASLASQYGNQRRNAGGGGGFVGGGGAAPGLGYSPRGTPGYYDGGQSYGGGGGGGYNAFASGGGGGFAGYSSPYAPTGGGWESGNGDQYTYQIPANYGADSYGGGGDFGGGYNDWGGGGDF